MHSRAVSGSRFGFQKPAKHAASLSILIHKHFFSPFFILLHAEPHIFSFFSVIHSLCEIKYCKPAFLPQHFPKKGSFRIRHAILLMLPQPLLRYFCSCGWCNLISLVFRLHKMPYLPAAGLTTLAARCSSDSMS